MSAVYEFWLLDDAGNRLLLINNFSYVTYTKRVSRLGIIQIGFSFQNFQESIFPYFSLDRRIEVWRSPQDGMPLQRDAVFLLREPRIYTRDSDGFVYLEFYGRSPIDLLKRRSIPQYAGSSYTTKTDNIDDMMKSIVRENMLYGSVVDETGTADNDRAYPQYEFSVQSDYSLGPSISRSFADSLVYETLEELSDISLQLNKENSSNRRVYFDVVHWDLNNFIIYILDGYSEIVLDESGDPILDETSIQTLSPIGFQFQTYIDRYGVDRTQTLEFSEENGNFQDGSYKISHMDEINTAYVKGQGEGLSRQVETVIDEERANASRWNRVETIVESSQETSAAGLQAAGNAELEENKPVEELSGSFLSIPASENNPSSLYGLDWGLGDLVRVKYGGKFFDVEVLTVHVSLNDQGEESISGRSVIE